MVAHNMRNMNKYNPNIRHRRSIRLNGYDYAQAGLYFITICTQNRLCLFANIEYRHISNGHSEMILNDAGKMINDEWNKIPKRFKNIQLHEYIIMPNHFHAIVEIVVGAPLVGIQNNDKDQPQGVDPTYKTVGDIIGAFKSITTVEYIRGVKNTTGNNLTANYGNGIVGNILSEMNNRTIKLQNI